MTLLSVQANEWNVDLWLGLGDFEKAFDSIEHSPLWEALAERGVHNRDA